jgi:hypothetical protein
MSPDPKDLPAEAAECRKEKLVEEPLETDVDAVQYDPPNSVVHQSPEPKPADTISDHQITHGIRPAQDCPVDWNDMQGDGCLRYCKLCNLPVAELKDLSQEELEQIAELGALKQLIYRDPDGLITLPGGEPIQLFRRLDGRFVLGDCYTSRCPPRWMTRVLILIPLGIAASMASIAGGYIFPFLNYPTTPWLMLGLVVWHLIGCYKFSRAINRFSRVVTIMMFTVPIVLYVIFGPAALTILYALQTVLHAR